MSGEDDNKKKDQKDTFEIDGKPLKDFSEEDLRKLIPNLVESKRSANKEAKDNRLKITEISDKLAEFEDAKKKDAEKDLEAKELLTKRDAEIEALKQERDNLKGKIVQKDLVARATNTLREAGFGSELVEVGLPDNLSKENFDDSIKAFKKRFKNYVKDPADDRPDPNQANQPGARTPKPDDSNVSNKAGAAIKELHAGGAKK
jgi:hypothetical protein